MIQTTKLSNNHNISRIIFWGRQLSKWHWSQVDNNIQDTLAKYIEQWVITFDCADIYTWVEEIYWEMLLQVERIYGSNTRSRIKIHTKCVPDINDIRNHVVDLKYIESIIDRSLLRLWVDQLDLVQLHHRDYNIPTYIEIAQYLNQLKSKGKISQIWVTNYNAQILGELIDSWIPIISSQNQYSLLDARPEKNLISLCEKHQIKILSYGTLAGWLLTDTYLGKEKPCEPLENRSLRKYLLMIDEFWWRWLFQNLLYELREIANKYNVSIADVSMRYVLEKRNVAWIIVWARNNKHIHGIHRSFTFTLDDQDYSRINRILDVSKPISWWCFDIERYWEKHSNIMKMNLNKE